MLNESQRDRVGCAAWQDRRILALDAMHRGDTKPEWVVAMITALASPDPAHADLPAALRAKGPYVPARLFRYRPCSPYSITNLERGSEWLSSASEYNDPYDSSFAIGPAVLDRALAASALGQVRRALRAPTLSKVIDEAPDDRRAKAEELRATLEELLDRAETFGRRFEGITSRWLHKHVQRSLYVCSFAQRPDSMLMWSHYAAHHRGFCVEYTLDTWGADQRDAMFPVIYDAVRFDASPYAELTVPGFNRHYMLLSSLHKAPEWSYEQEWRLVFPDVQREGTGYSHPLPKPSRVYLGARIGSKERRRVLQIAKRRNLPVSLITLAPTTYDLIAEPVT